MTATPLSATDRAALLGIARAALRHRLCAGPAPTLPAVGPLAEPRGAFVTLRRGGSLRGCVGTFAPTGPLCRVVAEMAVAAASQDPRFPPLEAAELDDLDLHVSVLSPLRPMKDPSEIAIGRDGILVRRGWHRGTLLPAVAVENGWGARTFLARTCLKAGLPPDAWQAPDAQVELFSAEELGSPDGG